MTDENRTEILESLGEYLVQQRRQRGLGFEDIQEETKIPPKALKAMEMDDYSQLPADAFARGFYMLYAKHLDLDPTEILQRFDNERAKISGTGKFTTTTTQLRKVDTLAARPSMATSSALGFNLVILIAAVSLVCWYFSWNPATYLSEKLRSFQEPTTTGLQADSKSQIANPTNANSEDAVDSKHFLTLDFLEDTTITISVDDSLPEKEVYTKGSTRSWYARASISLILPETASVEVFFDGLKLDLPQPQGGIISLELP